MGKYNSSLYRIVPLMNEIQGNLAKLNKLFFLLGFNIDSLPLEYYYGENEKLLKPSKEFLLRLVEYIRSKDASKINYKKSRHKLIKGNNSERDEETLKAKEYINENYSTLKPNSRHPYIFEDFTHPDIFIEGEDYIIIVEGKWTENSITTHTENLDTKIGEYRCQMIRHIQASINYSNKKVYAFYIVDSKCGYLNDLTKHALELQIKKETIQLDEITNKKVLDSFYGYTTWQKIKEILSEICFLSKEDIDKK